MEDSVLLSAEVSTPSETLPGVEIKKPHIEKMDLKNAIAFRIKFPPQTENDANNQVDLINRLRDASILAFEESTDTVLGFIETKEQLEIFKRIASTFPGGHCGFGASRGESRLWVASDTLPDGTTEEAIIATCEATNAAARAVYSDSFSLAITTQDLATLSNDNLFSYRYLTDGERETDTSRFESAVGAKNTSLEKIPITTILNDEPTASAIPDLLLKKIERDNQTTTLHNVTELSVLNVDTQTQDQSVLSLDVNGFSKAVHDSSYKLEQAQKNNDAVGVAKYQKEVDTYLELIASFFSTLEATVRNLIAQKDPHAVVHTIDWRGDAGGIIAPRKFRSQLLLGYALTMKQFEGSIDAKASAIDHDEVRIQKNAGGKTLIRATDKVNEQAEVAEKIIKAISQKRVMWRAKINQRAPQASLLYDSSRKGTTDSEKVISLNELLKGFSTSGETTDREKLLIRDVVRQTNIRARH